MSQRMRFSHRGRLGIAFTVPLCAISMGVCADGSVPRPAPVAHAIFSAPLSELPGRRLVAVRLHFEPGARQPMPHRHPGSVYVYVTKGVIRLGLEGQPTQVVHAGESFFEPFGSVHAIAENPSTTQPATAIAVEVVPEGVPLLTPEQPHTGGGT